MLTIRQPGGRTIAYGPGAWHNLALGVQADAEKKLAFSADKADTNKVEWMSYIAGPSLEILKGLPGCQPDRAQHPLCSHAGRVRHC